MSNFVWSHFLKKYKKYFIIFTLLLLLYIISELGVFYCRYSFFNIENFFILFMFFLFAFVQKDGKYKYFLPFLLILSFIVFYDIYFKIFGRVFKPAELKEIPELLGVLKYQQIIILLLFFMPLILFLYRINYKNISKSISLVIFIVAVFYSIHVQPELYTSFFNGFCKGEVEWSDKRSVEENGRFQMLFYYEAKRMANLKKIKKYVKNRNIQNEYGKLLNFLKKHNNESNIHLLILESFIDPTLLRNVEYLPSPKYKLYQKIFSDKEGFSKSPVFGGHTSQAEFEVLCGVPALRKIDVIEFNAFTGSPVLCLPNILKKLNYLTIASNAYKPFYFNTISAYSALGFEKIFFPKEYSPVRKTYLTTAGLPDWAYLFDGDLFKQNISYLKKILKKTNRPILNYVLGIYGHHPFYLDKKLYPPQVKVKIKNGVSFDTEEISKIANQYYYRTKAIAEYIRELNKIDPHSLIIIVSDHLPVINEDADSYKTFGYLSDGIGNIYTNRILMLQNGEAVKIPFTYHYRILNYIFDYLSSKLYCKKFNCQKSKKNLEQAYTAIMADAVK